jgi:membrane protease YdiL (CAAX protease family)
VAAACGYLFAFYLSSLVGAVFVSATGGDDPTLGQVLAVLVTQWVGLVAAALFASRRWGTGKLDVDLGLRAEPRDVPVGLVVGVLSQFVLVWLVYLPFRLLGIDLDVSEEARRLTGLAEGPGLALLGLFVILGAPLVEELFFRGLLQGALVRRFGPRWGVGGAALAFGVMHYQPVQLLGLVAIGVVLGVLALRAGRLGPALVAHVAFNAAAFTVLVIVR